MKIKTEFLKLSKTLHTWTGIISGIFLFICFIAGGLSVFQYQITQWSTPPQQVVNYTPQNINQFIQAVQKQVPITQDHFTLNLSNNVSHKIPMIWQEGHSTWTANIQNNHLKVEQQQPSELGHLIELLHETAGIPTHIGHEKTGVILMGFISLLYFIAIISGLILHLPTLVKDYLVIRKTKNKKRFLLDMHNVVGITNLPFHIIISLTVIVFAFHDVFFTILSNLTGQTIFNKPIISEQYIQKKPLDIKQILLKTNHIAPNYQVDYMDFNHLQNQSQAVVRIAIYNSDNMLRGANHNFVIMNPYTLEVTNKFFLNANGIEQFIQSMFALHFGSFNGIWTRWLYFILGIGGAFLFYTGNLLWIQSRKNKNNLSVKILEKITTGAMIGSVLAISLVMATTKWVVILGFPKNLLNLYFIYGYYFIFTLSIFYCLITDSKKSLKHLLFLTALSLFSFIFTSIIAFCVPTFGLWVNILSVDITAFFLAICFWYIYKKRSG